MEKLKVTVEFQNKFCDKLYNIVQKAEFAWLKENCENESKWVDLIQAVDAAMYSVIKEFFDNTEDNSSFHSLVERMEKLVEKLEEHQQLSDIQEEQRKITQEILVTMGCKPL